MDQYVLVLERVRVWVQVLGLERLPNHKGLQKSKVDGKGEGRECRWRAKHEAAVKG
jgi:hypothetical protein